MIIVASVSAIYGIGDPSAYFGMLLFLEPGQKLRREDLLKKLVEMLYERNDIEFGRGSFRVRGDVVEIYPSYQDRAYRVEFWGDEVESISTIDPLLGEVLERHAGRVPVYARSHYVTPAGTIKRAVKTIKQELDEWEPQLVAQGRLVEAQRLHQRTMYDLEMFKELGFCRGVENYSRHLTGRAPGEPPPTLFDYLPEDTIVVVDEIVTSRSRRSGGCSTATARASRTWSISASACRRRSTTGRSSSRSGRGASGRRSTSRQRRAPTS